MSAHTRTEFQREHDRVRIAEMYLQRFTQQEIAEEIGVCRQQISREIQKIRRQWTETYAEELNQALAEEVKKLDGLEREYWQRYRKAKTNPRVDGIGILDRVHKCIRERGELRGFYIKPVAGRGDKPKADTTKPLKEMTDDELEAALTERAVDQVFSDKPVKGGSENEPVKGGCPQDAIPAQPSTDPESIDMPESGGSNV